MIIVPVPVSNVHFERLKRSIKEEDGLMPIVLNQDRVVLDGHHRLRACRELGIPIVYTTKDFTDRPLDELKFVVSVNLHRRDLDEFQRAEIGLKMRNIAQRIANFLVMNIIKLFFSQSCKTSNCKTNFSWYCDQGINYGLEVVWINKIYFVFHIKFSI
jgi:ParB-like nuclease domain